MCIYLFSDMDLQDCIGASVEYPDTEVGNRLIVSIGPLRFIHGTEFDYRSSERLNRILSTDISWNKYEIGGCIGPMNVIVVLMEFIRGHMESGKHMVLYSRCGMVYLDPDMPVSNIDVSSKMPARSLLDGFEFDDDLIYHFYSSKKAEPKTAILDMMSCDGPFFCWHPGRRYWGSCPEEPISLGDLILKVKEEVAFVSVHDMDQTVRLAR
ncbi:MAG: hypothetical protein IJ904_04655 [Candidatus Methanomethylophilaceae archaeon]|nr:hypothetical protein [Candidatus Methanomethylophilaceae archaeon]